MKITAKELARALYLATRGASEAELPKLLKSFVATTKARGLTALLPDVLAQMPTVIESVDALDRITVETASPIDERTAREAIAAAGIDATGRDVVTKVKPDLIGGIRVVTNDKLVDASARHQLDELRVAVTR